MRFYVLKVESDNNEKLQNELTKSLLDLSQELKSNVTIYAISDEGVAELESVIGINKGGSD